MQDAMVETGEYREIPRGAFFLRLVIISAVVSGALGALILNPPL